MERHSGSEYLRKKYGSGKKALQSSAEVNEAVRLHSSREKKPATQKPAEKISIYLDRLVNVFLNPDTRRRNRNINLLRPKLHQLFTMLPDEVPESYFAMQRRIARKQGHGDVDILDRDRNKMAQTISRDQERSLDNWIDYLSSDDAMYPPWFKYYAFRSVIELADFDKKKGEFPKRSKSTTAPFPDINREALAYMYDSLNSHYHFDDKTQEAAPDQINPQTKDLLDQDTSFAKLYQHSIEISQPTHGEALDVTDGQWVKFDQGDDASPLSSSLQGYGTGWCTAGEGTAQAQLDAGDFYVYYSKSPDGEYSTPRVAMRMQNQGGYQQIAEVRGIEADQNLEGTLVDITEAKMNEIDPEGALAYKQKTADMAQLTSIEKQLVDNPLGHLSDEDLRFLYEFDHKIQGFGYERDPRIDEIISQRAGIDAERLKPLLIESIRSQVETSYSAAKTMLEQLNAMRDAKEQITIPSQEQFNQLVTEKFNRWRANGTLDFIVERLETHRERFTLVSTPNIIASNQEIYALAKEFGKNQPAQAYIDQEFLDLYTPEELSGQIETNDQPLRLTLIPDRYTDELGYSDVEEQLRRLTSMRQDHPNLYMPSMLEAISYWQSLRAQGDSLDDSETWDLTYIRHFDLEEKSFGGSRIVPGSLISNVGEPLLAYDDSDDDRGARVAVR